MRFAALATDYDGTIATHGTVDEPTLEALRSLKSSGRKLILVTGRELPDLRLVFSHLDLFDRIVAENGALLIRPASGEQIALAESPPAEFIDRLRQRDVSPLSVGRAIVATTEPNESIVLTTIRDLGLELQVVFNKGAVMILPSGVNKATGLAKALEELGLAAENVVAVGDAENDHAFLESCGCAVAVANALPALKERADFVTQGRHGAGVAELIDQLLANDLAQVQPRERPALSVVSRAPL
jgi:phosphoglycolate phosphatase (TIGR01487 family)